jgi:hypothetical protein
MTHFTIDRPEPEIVREARTPVRVVNPLNPTRIFHGWGPAF